MQQTLGFEDMYTRGGWRPGSGRKRNKQTMSHGVREFGYKSDPLLLTCGTLFGSGRAAQDSRAFAA